MLILKKSLTANFNKVWISLSSKFDSVLKIAFLFLIRCYQMALSPILGGGCRYYPSCSQYGAEAFQKHNFLKAFYLTTKRILRCHPFGGEGFDPVPEKHA
jgi:putative membrane protein insertion efficiency factor